MIKSVGREDDEGSGGSAWESNPPNELSARSTGFEIRTRHQLGNRSLVVVARRVDLIRFDARYGYRPVPMNARFKLKET